MYVAVHVLVYCEKVGQHNNYSWEAMCDNQYRKHPTVNTTQHPRVFLYQRQDVEHVPGLLQVTINHLR